MGFDLRAGGFRTVSGFRGFRFLAKVTFEWISWISIIRYGFRFLGSGFRTFRWFRGFRFLGRPEDADRKAACWKGELRLFSTMRRSAWINYIVVLTAVSHYRASVYVARRHRTRPFHVDEICRRGTLCHAFSWPWLSVITTSLPLPRIVTSQSFS